MSNLIKLSVSKSSTFQSCKKKYAFTYIHKLPRKEWSHHILGRFAHRILELFHLKYLEGSTDPPGKVMSIAFNESILEFKGKITAAFKEETFDICKKYLSTLNDPKFSQHKMLAVEKTFNLQINDGLILTGMIDRIQLDNDGIYHVLDYKTSKSKLYLKDDVLQLLTYAYVLYIEHPELTKVRASYVMLRHGCEYITKEFDLQTILTVKDIYEKYAADILGETEFPPTTSRLCEYCDFISSCEQGLDIVKNKFVYGKTNW